MSYSRRQLEALGEPLGDSVTRKEGGHIIYGGGGDSAPAPAAAPAPTATSTVTIPEYAKPYMENLLGKAQAATSAGYQTYGGARIAGASQAQQQARADVAGLDVPTQFGTATQMAQTGGLGALSAGDMARQAGSQYFGAVTSPGAIGAMMSPYAQNVMDVQKAAAIRDAQKSQLAADLNAARQGTYGGARQLLATTEREKALGAQLGEIQAKGTQGAYEQALKNLQFGTDVALKGYQTGIQGAQAGVQGAQTLGQLGVGQQQAALDLARAQETFGGLEQAERQRALDMAYQDFLAQQQYPYKQLGFMSDILRGSANLAGTGGKTMYEAPPSQLSQIVGPGLLGLGIYREFMKS